MEENKNIKSLKQGVSLDNLTKNYSVERTMTVRNKVKLENKYMDVIVSPKNSPQGVCKTNIVPKTQLMPLKTTSGQKLENIIKKSLSKKSL
jgi:hypothetical protein